MLPVRDLKISLDDQRPCQVRPPQNDVQHDAWHSALLARASTAPGCTQLPASPISSPTHAEKCPAQPPVGPTRPNRPAHYLQQTCEHLTRAQRTTRAQFTLAVLLILTLCCGATTIVTAERTKLTVHNNNNNNVTQAPSACHGKPRSLLCGLRDGAHNGWAPPRLGLVGWPGSGLEEWCLVRRASGIGGQAGWHPAVSSVA